MIKSVFVGTVQVTYEEKNEKFYVLSVVTHGNFVENYGGRISFDTFNHLVDWAKKQYN